VGQDNGPPARLGLTRLGAFVKANWGVIAGLALLVSACSTTGGSGSAEARNGFVAALPPMPAAPAGPVVRISDTPSPAAPVDAGMLEPVGYWRVIEDEILIVHADSHGCTARSDFTLHVSHSATDVYSVSLERARADICAGQVPGGVQLGFGFDELGVPVGGRVIVVNPLAGSEAARTYIAERGSDRRADDSASIAVAR